MPETLQQAILYFSDQDVALEFLTRFRWPDGKPTCPRCSSQENSYISTRRIWKCKGCKRQFSAKSGTVMEDSPIGLDRWLPAIWMLCGCKNGISSYEIARDLGVSQKTAWFMLHRIRKAMQDEATGGKLSGEVEVDESFIGGKARNMHVERRRRKIRCPGPHGKAIVAAVLERGGKVRATVIAKRRKKQLQALVRENVETGAALYSDALQSYDGLDSEYAHQVIDHAEAYVNGQVHTNGLENFWSLLKRGLKGTYVSVEPFHLFRYVDEQAYRFNNRKDTDAARFVGALSQIAGRRITFAELTGKESGSLPS